MANEAREAAEVRSPRYAKDRDEEHSWVLLDEVGAIISVAAALFILVSFASYDRGDVHANLGGPIGYGLANIAVQALGLAAYLVPPGLLALGWVLFRHATKEISLGRVAGMIAFIVSLAMALAMLLPAAEAVSAGGFVGGFVSALLTEGFGHTGSALIVTALLALSVLFATETSFHAAAVAAGVAVSGAASRLRARLRRPQRAAVGDDGERPVVRPSAKRVERPRRSDPVIVVEKELTLPARRPLGAPKQQELHFTPDKAYQPPSLEFLDRPQKNVNRIDEDALRKSSEILETKLGDFGIEGKVVAVRPGPVITTYEIEPAPGVKVSRIVTLADDLAMALRAPGVRVLAPVPGKAVVGIEVANARREHVALRDLLSSEGFAATESPVTLALGKDAAGNPTFGDLARMPHLLIAGATGTGKSVSINSMIVSILYKASPRDVRFVMIDLKMLELSVYEEIPHLLVPVVTDPKKTIAVLKNLARQMDERYQLLKEKGVRNIDSYNRMVEREEAEHRAGVIELDEVVDEDVEDAEPPVDDEDLAPAALRHMRMPKIVVIIDELADLMMTVGRDVEEPITRLAQKARAAGIHLILATQRPSVDVITGLIKANFPSRVSFQVTSRVDSRTILDSIGAERLLGGGDMLYLPPGTARAQRLHGGYVSEEEIRKIVDFIKRQGKPEYALDLLEGGEEENGEVFEEDMSDEMYDLAVQLVTESRQASISWLQRRLRVGYNRAARMIERMEREGVVTSGEGGRAREVIAQHIEE